MICIPHYLLCEFACESIDSKNKGIGYKNKKASKNCVLHFLFLFLQYYKMNPGPPHQATSLPLFFFFF